MQHIYYYLIIFVMGVLCSLTMMLFIRNFSITERKIPNYTPDVHYLQVRDDYSVYSLTSQRSNADRTFGGNADRKRSSVEGNENLIEMNSNEIRKFEISDENEALSTLKVALELRTQGKLDKAQRLYQHALALAPKHPEILNKYGEYLEHSNDIITADMMYFQVQLISESKNYL